MKKQLLLVMLAMLFVGTSNLFAQIEKNQSILNLGLGVNSFYVSSSGFNTTLPPIEGSFEYMTSDVISVGGFIGAYQSEFDYGFGSTTKFNYLSIGGLSNYHFVNDEKFNAYAGIRLGYLGFNANYEDDFFSSLDFKASGVLFGIQLGARYFFSQTIAANAEIGYGIALLNIGVSFKL